VTCYGVSLHHRCPLCLPVTVSAVTSSKDSENHLLHPNYMLICAHSTPSRSFFLKEILDYSLLFYGTLKEGDLLDDLSRSYWHQNISSLHVCCVYATVLHVDFPS